ncbi:hypothetical protein A8W25_09840 [Streptomyces sp. ERV7]|uniref:terminase small subunit n=1 Tax=Streptomyces sp. ERV7 TaxID=1322334 RepID=UPI0007F4E268|nr:hypothetical protein [Streptomyces sp. ERV7]OAR25826.1 hypothetical protein A8W25_09840 [Streptomyces sp. ERV7]
MGEALRAARHGEKADARYGALEALALTLARGIDGATEAADALNVARLSRPLMDVLRELRLTPASAPTPGGDRTVLDEWIRHMTTPVYTDGSWDAPRSGVPHPAQDRAG